MRNWIKNEHDLDELCTTSTKKANTGKNKMLNLFSGKGFIFPETWSINDKINQKALLSIPQRFYLDYENNNTIKQNKIKLAVK